MSDSATQLDAVDPPAHKPFAAKLHDMQRLAESSLCLCSSSSPIHPPGGARRLATHLIRSRRRVLSGLPP
eukprot:51888-Eustigmatos_ZCMA.PRE.1